jgi:hypothetical protein
MEPTTAVTHPLNLRGYNSIDNVIAVLEEIILESESNNNPLGYFAVLYQKVTKKVKEGIENNYFDDGARMEQLDIVFAERYIKAYYAYQKNGPVTASWKRAFDISSSYWPIVMQHLLVGINAHINLDLGIAAAEISGNGNIDDLENDFIKINEILSSLVDEVQNDLADIWPFLRFVLKKTGKVDNLLVDFSMKRAREGAWKFAKSIANRLDDDLASLIAIRDQKVAEKASIVTNPGAFIKLILGIIRMRERGSVARKIRELKGSNSI